MGGTEGQGGSLGGSLGNSNGKDKQPSPWWWSKTTTEEGTFALDDSGWECLDYKSLRICVSKGQYAIAKKSTSIFYDQKSGGRGATLHVDNSCLCFY